MAEPYCLAMVLCDAVHRDPSTGKSTILGTFSNFTAAGFPAKIKLGIYFAVTDGLGPVTLRFQLVKAAEPVDALDETENENRVFMVKTDVNFESPLVMVEGGLEAETILPAEGLYYCELWAAGEVLMSRRLTATKITSSNEGT